MVSLNINGSTAPTGVRTIKTIAKYIGASREEVKVLSSSEGYLYVRVWKPWTNSTETVKFKPVSSNPQENVAIKYLLTREGRTIQRLSKVGDKWVDAAGKPNAPYGPDINWQFLPRPKAKKQ